MHERDSAQNSALLDYCSKTLSFRCLDCRREAEGAERTAEWVIEGESVGKLGSVTDLASVSLRSISAGLKLNTTSCSTLLRTYLYSETLSSQDQMTLNPVVDAYKLNESNS